MAFFSTTLTASTAAQLLCKNKPNLRKVSQMIIRIRSMGTATYVGTGGSDSQDIRLTGVGATISIEAPRGRIFFDPSTIFVSSDTSDAVLEVFGEAI